MLFPWFAEDVPEKRWPPVVDVIDLPSVTIFDPNEWFQHRGKLEH